MKILKEEIRMYNFIAAPHDSAFKWVFADAALTAELLQRMVSERWQALIRWDAVELVSGEFVHVGIRSHADLLVKLPLQATGQLGDVPSDRRFVLCVLEHKSSPDRNIIQQVLGYAMAAYTRYKPLALPFMVVLYHGKADWDMSHTSSVDRRLVELVGTEADSKVGMDIRYLNLRRNRSPFADASIGLRACLRTMERIWWLDDEVAFRMHVQKVLAPLARDNRELMQKLLHYVISMQRRLTFEQVAAILKDIKPEQEVEDMRKSVWEQILDKGEAKGRAEGEAKGIVKERAEMAQRLIAKNFDGDMVREVTGLSTAELDALRHPLNGSQR